MTHWISLHTHSQYSILDSTISVKSLAKKAKELGMTSLALTDSGNLFGAIDFYKACKGEGIHPIIGVELMVAPTDISFKKKVDGQIGHPLIFLAKNAKGYANLCKLSSIAHVEGFYYVPRIDRHLIEKYHEGLICLTRIPEWVDFLLPLFGEDLYLELSDHQMEESSDLMKESWLYQDYLEGVKKEKALNQKLCEISEEKKILCVATVDIHYLESSDWKAHEILMNIQSGETCEIWEKDAYGQPKAKVANPKRRVKSSRAHYFRTPLEMETLFGEAARNTLLVAEKCQFEIDLSKKYYPVFIPPGEYSPEEREVKTAEYLRELSFQGISKRYTEERLAKVAEKYPGQDPLQVVRDRLELELEIITSKGMCDYLLIVYDFIAWAKSKRIPVGPGRGSGAGSIILYLIGITDIEPLRFNLFFERFINPERISYPDIDVDICMDRRSEVIEYTLEKYGRDKVAQIITFGTMKAKMAIKDVGRVLNVPLAKVNAISKLVPEDPTMTLAKAFELEPELKKEYDGDAEIRQVLDYAIKLEGSIRNTGVHAAGLIICGDPLTDHIPICLSKDADIMTTQYSMKPVESVGMLKIDFLGLKTLTSIQKCVDAIREVKGIDIDWVNLPLEDARTFDLLNQGKTEGVFQLESTGMQDLARQLHIDKFEEIIAVGALYRPGPMEMIPSFIARKHGREPIEIDHPLMKEIIEETYGIMVYQEQVMQIAQKLAGYSLGEGDVLRRAMGKKDHEEMQKQREKFQSGAVANGVDEPVALLIFDKIEKFASYGFNKSHAAAYGYLSYTTAYLKANYPSEWMASLMTCDQDDLTKVAKHIREAQSMGIGILSPDVNESRCNFVGTDKGIRFAMGGIKGVGAGVVDEIIRKRTTPFTSLYDFCKKIETSKVGKKVIELLIEAGCFDFTGWTRAELLVSLESVYLSSDREKKEASKGFIDFFAEDLAQEFNSPPQGVVPPPIEKILSREKELLGFYLTGHPMDHYAQILERLQCIPLSKLSECKEGDVCRLAFIIETVKIRLTAKGQRKFAILTIGDGMERFELPVWPSLFETHHKLIEENQLLFAVVIIERGGAELKLECRFIEDLSQMNEEKLKLAETAVEEAKRDMVRERKLKKDLPVKVTTHLNCSFDARQVRLSDVLRLKQLFHTYPGDTEVTLDFQDRERKVGKVSVASNWGIRYEPDLETHLRKLPFVLSLDFTEGAK
ncbi:MAG: DNA polymerase III subunit alpha [Simkaniaceae bacterium]|nr:DNA polymerase III subunit alpha [Simkaniaceae bacterium]